MIINNLSEFHEAFCRQRAGTSLIFRGVTDETHTLKPLIGRLNGVWAGFDHEIWIFEEFKRTAIPHLSHRPTSDWEWLAVAQHHGLPTRLLDWSLNPLVAAYFAVRQEADGGTDAAIYCLDYSDRVTVDHDEHPFKITEVHEFHPPIISQRISAQSGVFTIHPIPNSSLTGNKVTKWVIKSSLKKELHTMLHHYGFRESSMFPGTDSISSELRRINFKIR